jgi:hypothetical protein
MARELGMNRKTIKRILAQARPVPYRRTVARPSVVTPPAPGGRHSTVVQPRKIPPLQWAGLSFQSCMSLQLRS